ncbi:MAG: histidine phosphatase family protein [Streptosporangiales bacterium]|nr:histidine phosphatase family protein [Streptosporangiales bacterium]
MSEITVVHLLRHGEVENPKGVLYGRLPGYHLSDAGRRMAELAAEWFTGRDVVALFSSPLERARETAAPLATAFGLPVGVDERLIEAGNRFEGLSFTRRSLREPRHWSKFHNPFRPSWGEPYSEIAARMLAAAEQARKAGAGHEVVCVSHQLPIFTVRRFVERRRLWHRPDRRECGLTSVTSFTYTDDRIVAVDYAEPAGPLARRPGIAGA